MYCHLEGSVLYHTTGTSVEFSYTGVSVLAATRERRWALTSQNVGWEKSAVSDTLVPNHQLSLSSFMVSLVTLATVLHHGNHFCCCHRGFTMLHVFTLVMRDNNHHSVPRASTRCPFFSRVVDCIHPLHICFGKCADVYARALTAIKTNYVVYVVLADKHKNALQRRN